MKRKLAGMVGALAVVAGGVTIAQVASAQPAARGTKEVAGSHPALKGARWINLHGRWIYGVPVTVHVRARRPAQLVPYHGLRNVGSGLCMSSWPDQKGHAATQWPCNGSRNQQWVFGWDGPGLALFNAGMGYGTSTTWCLDNYQKRLSDGNPQIMWPCYAKWSVAINYHQGGSAAATNAVMLHTNDWQGNYCVTTLGNKTPGSTIQEWLCNKNSRNQGFVAR